MTKSRDPRVDVYIAKAAPFARPILNHLRAVVHEACPSVVETIKWGFPHFDYKGMLCGMAAFKAHAVFGFWNGALVMGDSSRNAEAMGDFGRITSREELPPKKVTIALIKSAMKLNDAGVKRTARRKPKEQKPLRVPRDLAAALAANQKAAATFAAFPPSQKREYVEWIIEAKTETTRERRLGTAIAWMAEGKRRNWKYM